MLKYCRLLACKHTVNLSINNLIACVFLKVIKAEHFKVFFFRYLITVKKYINNASKNASCYEAIFVIINTNEVFMFVICKEFGYL